MCAGFDCDRGMRFSGKKFKAHVEGVEVIAAECSLEDALNLTVVAGGFEFFRGAADGEIIYDDLALLQSALGDASQFAEFEVAEVLHADPDADAHNGKNQAKRTAGRPEQK